MRNELNQSTVFFSKLDALEFPELQALREKMDARSEPEIDILMPSIGVPVKKKEFKIDDGIPMVQNRKVVLYLQDAWSYKERYGDYPKYHVVDCKTLQNMKKFGGYNKYQATRRTDGYFLVRLSDSDELSPYKLNVCKNCLDELKSQCEPEDFPLADWLETFFDYASEDWKQHSQACRENANWTCEECGIMLGSNSPFLHAHHKFGTKSGDSEKLTALCIGCHADQPGGGHRMLKYYPDYDEFMKKYGSRWRQLTGK